MDNETKKNKSRGPGLLIPFLISVVFVHFPLLIFFAFFAETPQRAARSERVVQIDIKNMEFPVPASELPIANLDAPPSPDVPDRAHVQSTHNVVAKEETVAPKYGEGPLGPGPAPKMPAPKPAVKPSQPSASKPAPKTPNPKPAEQPKPVPQTNPFLPKPPTPTQPVVPPAPTNLKDELAALKNQQKAQEQKSFQRFGSSTSFNPVTGAGLPTGGGEFFPNYKIGNRTYLNALGNQRITYFVELKRKFQLSWNPFPSLRAQMQTLLSKGKVEVVMGVSVGPDGLIKELVVIRPSGVPAYDQEARRTITSNAPFSRPAAYLLTPDGMLHMAWTFTVYR